MELSEGGIVRYRVPLTTWANTTVDVETDSTDADEISRLAEENAYVSLCHQCADKVDVGDEWNAVETNGDPSEHITRLEDE